MAAKSGIPKYVVPMAVGLILCFSMVIGLIAYKLVEHRKVRPPVISSSSPSPPTPRPSPPGPSGPITSPRAHFCSVVGGEFRMSEQAHRACASKIGRLGQRCVERKKKTGVWPEIAVFAADDPVCPGSGKPYQTMVADAGHCYVFCPGHDYHGQRSIYSSSSRFWSGQLPKGGLPETYAAGVMLYLENRPRESLQKFRDCNARINHANVVWWGLRAALESDDDEAVQLFSGKLDSFPAVPILKAMRVAALGYMGRSADALKVSQRLRDSGQSNFVSVAYTGAVYLQLGQYDLAEKMFDQSGAELAHNKAWVSFYKKDFATTLKRSQAALSSLGYRNDNDAAYTRLAVLSGMALKGSSEDSARSILAEALRKSPKTWPYPLLRYLNGEIKEEELVRQARFSNTAQTEADWTIGTLQMIRGNHSEGRATLARVRQRFTFETGMAQRWLK